MSVVGPREILEARAAGWDRLYRRTYTRAWRVECSSRYDGPYTIRTATISGSPAVPPIGTRIYVSATELDAGSFVENHDYRCEHAGPNPEGSTWVVVVHYSPYDTSTFGSDPTLWPIKVTYGSKSYERTVERDQAGNAVRNSAGDRFETPVQVDDSRDLITVERNELVSAFDPTWPSLYRDTINSGTWNTFDAHCVKCTSITSSGPQYDSNNQVYYYTITYVFEVMYKDPDVSPNGWAKYILDQGYQYLDPGTGEVKRITGDDGQPVSDAALLDGSGNRVPPGGSPNFLIFDVYREMDFSVFNIDLSKALGR